MARESSLAGVKKKAPPVRVRLFIWRLAVTYSRTGTPALPSAMHRFTAEFGMGSGGSNALLPPGKLLGTRVFTLFPATGNSVNSFLRVKQRVLVLYDQVTRAISTG